MQAVQYQLSGRQVGTLQKSRDNNTRPHCIILMITIANNVTTLL